GAALAEGFEFGDEFDDRALDTDLWTVGDALHDGVVHGTDRGWVWEGTGEALVIKAAQGPYDFGINPSTANDGTVFTGPFVYREITGDFEVATEIDVVGLTINQEAGGFLCVGPTGLHNWFGLFRANFFGTRYLNLRIIIDDAVIVNAPGVVAGTKLCVKFTRAGDVYAVYYNTETPSDDDDYSLWTSFTTDKLGSTARLGYGVAAPSYGGTHTLRADWIRQISGAGDISDDFDDADWATDWTLVNPGPAKVFEETEDRLYVTTNDQASNFFDGAFTGPRVRREIPPGDFDVQTRVRGDFLTANVEGVHFIAAKRGATSDWFGIRLAYVTSLGGLAFLAESTTAGATTVHATSATTATEATLRIARVGDDFTASYRLLEADPWTDLATTTLSTLGSDADLVLGVSSGGAINFDVFGEFDYLRGAVSDPIEDATRWKTILFDSGAGGSVPPQWSQNVDAAYVVQGYASGAYRTGTRDESFLALTARDAPFDAPRRNATLAAWFRPPSSASVHYWGFFARLQPASPGQAPGDVTAADLRSESAYFVVVNRFSEVAIHRGSLASTSWTKRWPDGAVWVDPDPALTPLQGGYLWRMRLFDGAGGAPGFEIAQAVDPAADPSDDGAWTVVTTWYDTDAAGRIETPGFFGAFALTGGGNDHTGYVDALRALGLEE
ncbi:MAG: hypothetical protein KC466_03100, partial [Myxococcales bacterium]|nr:hypothetical protein [Myxococcales bacterium]